MVLSDMYENIEKLSLERLDCFTEIPIKLKICADCGLVSYKNQLYIFNKKQIGYFNDNMDYIHLKDINLEDDDDYNEWNLMNEPFSTSQSLYFFGGKNIIKYNIEANNYDVLKIPEFF